MRRVAAKFNISAEDETQKAFSGVEKSLDKLGGAFSQVGKIATGVGAAMGVSWGLDKIRDGLDVMIGGYADYEEALINTQRVTDESIESIKRKMEGLPKVLGTVTEKTAAYYEILSAGITDSEQALDTLTASSKAAKVASVDQSMAVLAGTKMMAGYGDEINGITDAYDALFTIERLGQTKFSELVPVIGGVTAMAAELNVGLNDLGGSLAQITKTAGSTSEASTRLEAILTGLIKPTDGMTKAIHALGFESGSAAIDSLGFVGVLDKLIESAGGSSDALGEMFESKEAIMGFLALAKNDFADTNDLIDKMAGRAGAADEAFARWEKSLKGLWSTAKNFGIDFAIVMGEELAPAISEVLTEWNAYLDANKEFIGLQIKEKVGGINDSLSELSDTLQTIASIGSKLNWLFKIADHGLSHNILVPITKYAWHNNIFAKGARALLGPQYNYSNSGLYGPPAPAETAISGSGGSPASPGMLPPNVVPFPTGRTYTGGLSMSPGAGSQLGGFTGRGLYAGMTGVNENSIAAMSAMMQARDLTFDFETTTEEVLDSTSQGWLSLSDDISMVMANATTSHENFFSAIVRGYEDMFTKLAAMYTAKAAVFGLFSLFGGADLLGGSLTKFLFPSFASGGVVSRPTLAVVGDDPRGPERVLNASENRAYEQGRGGVTIGNFIMNVPALEKQAMARENDRQLAVHIVDLFRRGFIKVDKNGSLRMGVA
jgi:TP901 family phage tail tape measure protein